MGRSAHFVAWQPPAADRMMIGIFAPPYALHAAAYVDVSVNGRVQRICCERPGGSQLFVRLTPQARPVQLDVVMRFAHVFRPFEVGHGPDRRALSVLLRGVAFENARTGELLQGSVEPAPVAIPPRGIRIAIILAGFAAALALTLYRPSLGLCALVLCIPFAFSIAQSGTTVTLPKSVLAGFVLGAIVRGVRGRAGFGKTGELIAVTLGIALCASAASSIGAPVEGAALRETLKIVEYLVTFLAAYACYRLEPAPIVNRAFAIVVLLVVGIALIQYASGAAPDTEIGRWFFPRLAGPLEGPNQLAAYLDLLCPVMLARVLFERTALLERSALAAGAVGLLLTLSRGGIAAGVVGCAVVAVVRYRPDRLVAALAAAAALWFAALVLSFAVGAGAAPWATAVFGSTGDLRGGLGTRTLLWTNALRFWRAHPWLGVGPGNFELQSYAASGVRTHANSLFLNALAEGGVVGFIAAVLLSVVPILAFMRRARIPLVAGVLGACTAIALHHTVDTLWIYPKVGSTWMILLALAATCCDGYQTSARTS